MRHTEPKHSRHKHGHLHELISDGKCVAFVGSGFSNQILLPWKQLVIRVYNRCCGKELSEEEYNPTDDEYFTFPEMAKTANKAEYYKVLREEYCKTNLQHRGYTALFRLTFKFYVTVNFDNIMADYTKYPEYNCNKGYVAYPNIVMKDYRTAYHIHGIVENSERMNIVLTESEFDKAYKSAQLKSFLTNLFLQERIVFIACRLSERELHDVIKISQKVRKQLISEGLERNNPKNYQCCPK